MPKGITPKQWAIIFVVFAIFFFLYGFVLD